jgi:glycosyltransferase involved in cell wall biosynthesis
VVIPRRGIDYPLKNKIQYRLSYNYLASAVIANSYSTKRSLLKNAPWLNPDKIHVIYNGINPNPYLDPIENGLKTELRIHKNHKIIGFVGQLDERKGLDYLLSSFKRISLEDSTAHLCLIGKGPLEGEINAFRSQNNLKNKIHLLGFRNDIVNIMKSIDILVLPSLWEGFGIVLIEAMAAAKPAIVTDTSSMPEIVVDGETGRVVPVKDAEALSRAMLEVLHDDAKAREWGQQGRQRVFEFFHVDQMINQLEFVFQTTWAMKKS